MRKPFAILASALVALVFAGCDVDVEDEGSLPDVDVEGGEMPDVDVRGPEIDAEMKETTVEVPDVDVDIPEENEE